MIARVCWADTVGVSGGDGGSDGGGVPSGAVGVSGGEGGGDGGGVPTGTGGITGGTLASGRLLVVMLMETHEILTAKSLSMLTVGAATLIDMAHGFGGGGVLGMSA